MGLYYVLIMTLIETLLKNVLSASHLNIYNIKLLAYIIKAECEDTHQHKSYIQHVFIVCIAENHRINISVMISMPTVSGYSRDDIR